MDKLSTLEQDIGLNFKGPIPGQSLTNSPAQKYPWESPPEFTNVTEAQMHLFAELTEKEKFIALTDALADKVPVDIIVRTILLDGFGKGLWTPDLFLLLIEPLAVIIMAIGERVGIDYVFQDGDQSEADEDDEAAQRKALSRLGQVEQTLKETIKNTSLDKQTEMLAKKVQKGLETIPEPLVESAKENIQSKSLLERTDG
jgi:hypothetical protein